MNARQELQIELVPSHRLDSALREEIVSLCSLAYEEDFAAYFQLLSPAVHALGRSNGTLVAHLAWVERELRVAGLGPLRSAYIEAVATLPEHRRRGYASTLLTHIPAWVHEFDLAALSPSDDRFYARLGWELWQGPLSYLAPNGEEIDTPQEQAMIYRLPRTPASLDLHAKLTTHWRAIEVW